VKTIGKTFLKITTVLGVISFARDYYISFDFVNVNNKLIVSNFVCSKALSEKTSFKKFLFSLPLDKNIKTTCEKNRDFIVSKLLKLGVRVSNYTVLHGRIDSKTKIVFLPKRFDIIIKNDRVYFYLKEED